MRREALRIYKDYIYRRRNVFEGLVLMESNVPAAKTFYFRFQSKFFFLSFARKSYRCKNKVWCKKWKVRFVREVETYIYMHIVIFIDSFFSKKEVNKRIEQFFVQKCNLHFHDQSLLTTPQFSFFSTKFESCTICIYFH